MIKNALFLCVVCALVFVFYLPSYVKMQDMNEKNQTYAKRISDLERENTRLDEERRRLTDDPVYFEKVAREKMGIIKDGEVLYKIVGPGQKKNGPVSEEASFIIKSETSVDAVKAAAKPKVAAKKKIAKPKTIIVKPAVKKDTKAVVKKAAPTTAKKKSTAVDPKTTTVSTKE